MSSEDYETPGRIPSSEPQVNPTGEGFPAYTATELGKMLGVPASAIKASLRQVIPDGGTEKAYRYVFLKILPDLVKLPAVRKVMGDDVVDVDGTPITRDRLMLAGEIADLYRSWRAKVQYDLETGAVLDKDITADLISAVAKSLAEGLDSAVDSVDRMVGGLDPEVHKSLEASIDAVRDKLYADLVSETIAQKAMLEKVAISGRSISSHSE